MALIVGVPAKFGPPPKPYSEWVCKRCEADMYLPANQILGLRDWPLCVVCAMAIVKPGDTIQPRVWLLDLGDDDG